MAQIYNDSNIYIILGMHKSGTTLLAKLLMDSGINMGAFDMDKDYDRGNHLERAETQNINKKLLRCGNKFSLDVVKPIILEDISADQFSEGVKEVKDISLKYSDWGFKDPRTCLTYQYWKQVLPRHRLILVYRHPAEVVKHYSKWRGVMNPLAVKKSIKALACWQRYNEEILKILNNKKNKEIAIFNFGSLVNDDSELHRLEQFVNRKIHDCREPEKYRSKVTFNMLYIFALYYNKLILKNDSLKLYEFLEEKKNMFIANFSPASFQIPVNQKSHSSLNPVHPLTQPPH
ncbi:MAG: sulfotransferase [Desulfobacteraceae bacterium]|nr:sulfotransferase [Desulfobacteraceae bacterium]